MARGAWIRTALAGTAAVLALALAACARPAGRTPRTASTVATLHLSPAAGPPGTVVTVSGTATPSAAAGAPYGYATVCFEGCADGYLEQAVAVRWAGDAFRLHMRVPAAPWVTAAGTHPLRAGTQSVDVRCLLRPVPKRTCDPARQQARGTFRLTGPIPRSPVPALAFTPDRAAPGTTVAVSGWAPLSPLLGEQPAGFTLVPAGGATAALTQLRQSAAGALQGTWTVPPAIPGLGVVAPGTYLFALHTDLGGLGPPATLLPPAALTVVSAPPLTWAGLGRLHPLWIAPAVGAATAVDPSDPLREARCTATGLQVSADGGRTWSAVPTAGVLAAAQATAFTLFPSGPAAPGRPLPCVSVALDPAHPSTMYAAFTAAPGNPPPQFWLPFETLDGGRTWRAVPAPRGADPAGFGRFIATASGAVQAIWSTEGDGRAGYVVEQAAGGGGTWGAGRLGCPAKGACVVWGPAPNGSWPGTCSPQLVLASADGGATWGPAGNDGHVCYVGTGPSGPYELAALSPTEVALLGNWSQPMLLSQDGGRSWAGVALPLPPPSWDLGTDTDRFPNLRMLPDGALQVDGWVLPPGAPRWCAIGGVETGSGGGTCG